MKNLIMILLLAGVLWACTPTTTGALANFSMTLNYGDCLNLTDINSTITAAPPVNISLTLNPPSTANSTNGAWGVFSVSGNLFVQNTTNTTNITIQNTTIQNITIQNTTIIQNISNCDLALFFSPIATEQNFTNPSKNLSIIIHPIPPINASLTLGPNSTANSTSGPYWNFVAQYNAPPIVPNNVSLALGASADCFAPGTSSLISRYSCAQTQTCDLSFNITPGAAFSFSNTTGPCDVNVSVQPIATNYCYENQTSTYYNASVFRNDRCNITNIFSPPQANNSCPLIPTGVYNATPGETAAFGQFSFSCPVKEITTTKVVPFNSTYQNVPENMTTIPVNIPVAYIHDDRTMQMAAAGQLPELVSAQSLEYQQQANASMQYARLCRDEIDNQYYGWRYNYTILNSSINAPGGLRDQANGNTGIWIFTTIVSLGLFLLACLGLFLRGKGAATLNRPLSQPLAGADMNENITSRFSQGLGKKEGA